MLSHACNDVIKLFTVSRPRARYSNNFTTSQHVRVQLYTSHLQRLVYEQVNLLAAYSFLIAISGGVVLAVIHRAHW